MKSIDFMRKKLNDLVKRFPNLKVAYQFDWISDMHIVEVMPKDLFENSNKYKLIESEISFEFDNKYFTENLLFVSEGSLNRVETSTFEIIGKDYVEYKPELFFEFANNYLEETFLPYAEMSNIISFSGLGIKSTIFDMISAGILINDNVSIYEETYSTDTNENYALAA